MGSQLILAFFVVFICKFKPISWTEMAMSVQRAVKHEILGVIISWSHPPRSRGVLSHKLLTNIKTAKLTKPHVSSKAVCSTREMLP